MSDESIEAELAAYVDGVLPPEQARHIERRLAANARHQRMVREMRQAKAWLASLPPVRVPAAAAAAADPTVARLERAALFGEDEPPEPTGWELWKQRLLSPNALGIAASLAVLATLAIATYVLLPGDTNYSGIDDLARLPPETQNDPDANRTAPNPSEEPDDSVNGAANRLPDDGGGGMEDAEDPGASALSLPVEPDESEVADAGRAAPDESLSPPEVELPPLPPLEETAVVLTASMPDLRRAGGTVAASLTAAGHAFVVRPDAASALPDSILRTLSRHAEINLGEDMPDAPAHVVFVVEDLTRLDIDPLMSRLASDTPLALWERRFDGGGHRRYQSAQAEQLRLPGPDEGPDDPPVPETPDSGSEATDDEIRDEMSDEEAARRIYPNDQLTFHVRRTNELPPNLPEVLAETLAEPTASFSLAIDADGYVDLSPLFGPGAGEKIDVLGQSPRELADLLELRLGEYSIAASLSGATSHKADVPGGRIGAVLDLLKIDRNPFRPGDLVRVVLPDETRLEAVVEADGGVSLGVLGRFDAGGRTAGNVQRDVMARLARPDLAELAADFDPAVPPSVVNLSSRRAAARDDTAEDPIDLVVVLVANPANPTNPTDSTLPAPSTRPATQSALDAATRPAPQPDDWRFE